MIKYLVLGILAILGGSSAHTTVTDNDPNNRLAGVFCMLGLLLTIVYVWTH